MITSLISNVTKAVKYVTIKTEKILKSVTNSYRKVKYVTAWTGMSTNSEMKVVKNNVSNRLKCFQIKFFPILSQIRSFSRKGAEVLIK